MPRKQKPPRLICRKARRGREAKWVILYAGREHSTGCSEADTTGAQKALENFLAKQRQPIKNCNDLALIPVADVVNIYLLEHAPSVSSTEWIAHMLAPIIEWWGDKTLSQVKAVACRDYVEWRLAQGVSTHTARSNLKELRAAINYYHREHGPLPSVPAITLPKSAPTRTDYWLTRKQVAARIKAARKRARCGHVARVILIGIYTGTRPGTARELRWIPSTTGGWFDLETETLHRRPQGEIESNKRKAPARIHKRLLPHLRRWRDADMAKGITHCIHYYGRPIKKLRNSWRQVALDAGQPGDDGSHICRHTAATWQMQSGVPLADAAGYLSMDPKTLWDVYGHHHPDFQGAAASADGRRPRFAHETDGKKPTAAA
ncbi:MAG: hypothetical protein AAFV45_15735 [Pseudomonadota bacterium]